jgi:hypothetical protein
MANAPIRVAYLRNCIIFIWLLSSIDAGILPPANESTATDAPTAVRV